MGAPHGHTLHYHAHSVVHSLPAHLKILALIAFMVFVVATRKDTFWPYATYLCLLLIVIFLAKVPLRYLGKRLVIELPFVFLAILMPFVATGPTVEFLGLSLAMPGLWGAWTLLSKGTLGVLAALSLAATTETRDLLAGLQRLHVPAALVEIMAFMIRYLDLLLEQWKRMRIARESRLGVTAKVSSWKVLGAALGSLFIRSYERGERVHLAMISRGYQGAVFSLGTTPATTRQLEATAIFLLLTIAIATLSWCVR